MKAYLSLYRWAMQMKLHMAMYTFVAIFLKIICHLLLGMNSIPIVDLLTIWLVCLLFAMVETAIFPEGSSCTKGRTILWFAAANLFFIGGALLFDWFASVPAWGAAVLIAFLELGLGLMWFGDQFVLKMDSAQLTQQLMQYQRKNKA